MTDRAMPVPLIIAVDGPSASGKGTLARQLAAHYHLRHLDTGALYRIVGLAMQLAGQDFADEAQARDAARQLDLSLLEHPSLRTEATGRIASLVSAHPGVRAALLQMQRDFARQPPGAVLDGRDIGTVVCPEAQAKLFITADVAERARRRAQDMIACGQPQPYADILADLEARDRRDMQRAQSPLVPAADALILDTSRLDIAAALKAAIQLIEARLAAN